MKTNLKDKTCIVIDHGIHFPVAQKMAESFGKVYYFTPWEKAFPSSNETLYGCGFDNVERTDTLWDKIDKIDLFIFTDIYHSDWQQYLEGLGKRVWGAREGDQLEIDKWGFLQYLKKIGLPVPEAELVIGMDDLRKALKKEDDLYIKMDAKERGDAETFHHVNYDVSESYLDSLTYNLGAKAKTKRFIVQKPIDAIAEIGYDGYVIDGKYPSKVLFGIEVKDCAYVGEVREYQNLPKEIKDVNAKLSETFKAYGYRGNFSSEIRVGKDGNPYLIDPTCRFPSPPTAVMLEIYSNLAEIIYEGAAGVMVEPEFNAKFGAEGITTSMNSLDKFTQIFYPEEMKQWVKQSNICCIDGKTYVIPDEWNERVCEVVSIGDDIESVVSTLKERIGKVQGLGIGCDMSGFDEAILQLKKL